jgi:hypothetical protein
MDNPRSVALRMTIVPSSCAAWSGGTSRLFRDTADLAPVHPVSQSTGDEPVPGLELRVTLGCRMNCTACS